MRPALALNHCQKGKLRLREPRASRKVAAQGFRPRELDFSLCLSPRLSLVLILKDKSTHALLSDPTHPRGQDHAPPMDEDTWVQRVEGLTQGHVVIRTHRSQIPLIFPPSSSIPCTKAASFPIINAAKEKGRGRGRE